MTPAQEQDIITPQDWYQIANIYAANKLWGKAKRFFEMIQVDPSDQLHWDAKIGWALAKVKSGEPFDASIMLDAVIGNSPTVQPYAHNVYGVLHESLANWEEAEESFLTAVSFEPNNPVFRVNLAHLYHVLGRFPDAEAAYDAVIKLDPTNLETRFYRSLALLAQGRFKEGFREYEMRYATAPSPVPMNGKATWRGEQDLTGKTILMCAEQGIGDSVMCVRYARWLKIAKGAATVVVLAKPDLAKLLDFADGVDFCVQDPEDAEPYDFNVPMMSLPGLSLDRFDSIWYGPSEYIRIQESRKFQIDSNKLKVGFCWQGQPQHGNDRYRSVAPEVFEPLLAMDITAVSLQHGAFTPKLMLASKADSLFELAQQIQALDLIITVDTSVAHIAGALGIECWVLMYCGCDWRYGTESSDTAWYPSMRLFRQRKPLEWEPVIANIKEALREKLQANV